MIREAIDLMVNQKRDLREEQAQAVMTEIMSGEATPAQMGAFLTALRLKGETVEEIVGMARVMREKAHRIHIDGALLDTCGTGGDAKGTFNVSTAAAFVAAACGVRVAKHGNRAMSSRCGSADVLEALGARIDLAPEQVKACLEQTGIAFMFAPNFHPAMKHAAGPRREIGIRTVFNILGPLSNPAGADHQLLGVAEAGLAKKMAQALAELGSKRALVIHGQDGLDEVSIGAPTLVWEVQEGKVRHYSLTPTQAGFDWGDSADVAGGTAQENAQSMRAVLSGQQGPLHDFVILNAAAALMAAEVAADLKEGATLAARAIDSGAAVEKLEQFIEVTRSFSETASA